MGHTIDLLTMHLNALPHECEAFIRIRTHAQAAPSPRGGYRRRPDKPIDRRNGRTGVFARLDERVLRWLKAHPGEHLVSEIATAVKASNQSTNYACRRCEQKHKQVLAAIGRRNAATYRWEAK